MGSPDEISFLETEEMGWIDIDIRRLPERRLRGDTPSGIFGAREGPKLPQLTLVELGTKGLLAQRPVVRTRTAKLFKGMQISDLATNLDLPPAELFVLLRPAQPVRQQLEDLNSKDLVLLEAEGLAAGMGLGN